VATQTGILFSISSVSDVLSDTLFPMGDRVRNFDSKFYDGGEERSNLPFLHVGDRVFTILPIIVIQ
jgi:hypothetical protein